MNGFNSKVVCKNPSVTIWEILVNIAILIIHHKLYLNGGFATTRGVVTTTYHCEPPLSLTMGKLLWYIPPPGTPQHGG